MLTHHPLLQPSARTRVYAAVMVCSISCGVDDAGAAALPATGLGANNRASRWDRGMLMLISHSAYWLTGLGFRHT